MVTIMRAMVILEADPTPPIRIPPPGIIIPPRVIIRIGVGKVIVFLPKVDLLARNKRIAVIHLSKRLELFAHDFTCYGNSPSFAIEIRV